MSNKMACNFTGFEEMLERLDKISGNIKPAVTDCLVKGHELVTKEAAEAIKKHYKTGATERSLIDKASVIWEGTNAHINVGFDIKNGGMASIFLMYGTPRMQKDQQLYNTFHGKKIKKRIEEIQKDIMQHYLSMSDKNGG